MVTAVIILTSIGVFFVAAFSPLTGTAIQRKSRQLLHDIRRFSQHRPRIVRWFMVIPSHISHFAVHNSAAVGKKLRWKLPF